MTHPLTQEIDECPFCGGASQLVDATKVLGVWRLVHRCKVLPVISIEKPTQEACVATWNTRWSAHEEGGEGVLIKATQTYFDKYMQDEADDAENCVCGEEQHLAALAVKKALASISHQPSAHQSKQGVSLEKCARALNERANKKYNFYYVGKDESFDLAKTVLDAAGVAYD